MAVNNANVIIKTFVTAHLLFIFRPDVCKHVNMGSGSGILVTRHSKSYAGVLLSLPPNVETYPMYDNLNIMPFMWLLSRKWMLISLYIFLVAYCPKVYKK